MSIVNVKQLYVTKSARLDISMSPRGIYLTIYKPVGEKETEDGRKLPIFRNILNNNQVIENKVTIKMSEYEFGFLKWLMEEYLKYVLYEKIVKKLQLFSNMNRFIKLNKNEQNGTYYFNFYRPERPFNINLLQEGISITVFDKSKNPIEVYNININMFVFPYIISTFDFIIQEYLKKYKYEIDNNKNDVNDRRTPYSTSNADNLGDNNDNIDEHMPINPAEDEDDFDLE